MLEIKITIIYSETKDVMESSSIFRDIGETITYLSNDIRNKIIKNVPFNNICNVEVKDKIYNI